MPAACPRGAQQKEDQSRKVWVPHPGEIFVPGSAKARKDGCVLFSTDIEEEVFLML